MFGLVVFSAPENPSTEDIFIFSVNGSFGNLFVYRNLFTVGQCHNQTLPRNLTDKDLMDLEFVTEGVSEDDTFNIDQNNDDYSTFEGERCGICMDIVIDRGVLDCCQHWYTSLFLKKVWS
ncbi:hypothetical protein LOK49_LG13G00956 [Camellia lanceoleosa]|uniref:Uncharacterized protein n=1 Tax=Camellia lanceoleosa TaxID=1840588 RepID=A0ACC0FRN1_9ERIC|nr:hypothetical protein LOK49_LG13G00956 [Camellia lanceoleosa]